MEQVPGIIYISQIFRDNSDYRSFKAVRIEEDNDKEPEQSLVTELYKPSKALNAIFMGYNNEYYEKKDLPAILWKYVADHKLDGPTKSQVTLDPILSEAIFQKQKKTR